MFGFGRPSREKSVINLFVLQFEAIGISRQEAVQYSTKMVDEVLATLGSRGIDPFKLTQGDEYALDDKFVAPRLSAGLVLNDIRFYWNRALLVVLGEMKMRQMFNFMVVDIARQQGKDTTVAAMNYKKTFPRYGDPDLWDPSEKFNIGLQERDADLYPEFSARVEAWRRKYTDIQVSTLIFQYGTLNAVIRHQISVGAL